MAPCLLVKVSVAALSHLEQQGADHLRHVDVSLISGSEENQNPTKTLRPGVKKLLVSVSELCLKLKAC